MTNQKADSPADAGVIEAGPFRLRYCIEGTGHPTIVIGSAIYYPRAFSRDLRQNLRMVFLDHRGFAASPGPVPTSMFALETLVDDIECARQELGLGRIAIMGHSGHSFMALEYAKKYPQSVSHVIMIGCCPDFSAASLAMAEQYWQDSVNPDRKAVMAENLRRLPDEQLKSLQPGEAWIRTYVRNAPRIWYDPRFDASRFFEGVAINMDMYNHVWGEIFRDINIGRGLESFNRPVLLALGRYDFLVAPPSSWDRIRPLFHDLTVRVFERSGHAPQTEEEDLFDAELLTWMDAHQDAMSVSAV
jgi:proline iminopeptidase